jgi:hypothetical protein
LRRAGFVVNARFMEDLQSEQLHQQLRIEALQFENERLRCVTQRRKALAASVCIVLYSLARESRADSRLPFYTRRRANAALGRASPPRAHPAPPAAAADALPPTV